MKYLLINPPIHDVLPFVGMSQPTHLLRVGAFLRSQGHTVNLFDYEPIHMTGPDRVSVPSAMVRTPERTEIIKTYGKIEVAVLLNRYGKRSRGDGPGRIAGARMAVVDPERLEGVVPCSQRQAKSTLCSIRV